MSCNGVNSFGPSCTYFQGKEDIGYVVGYVALAIIAACGLALSVCSLISYLPPEAGYFGGSLCISSLIIFAVLSMRKCSIQNENHSTNATDAEQGQILPKISNGHRKENGSIKTREVIPLPILPDDVFVRIVEFLGARSVWTLSQVCLRWSQVVSIDSLWQKFCQQESFCTYGKAFPPHCYKEAYQKSKIFKNRLLLYTPEQKISVTALNKPSYLGDGDNAFLITKERCFIYHPGTPENQIEIWDATLKTRLLWKTIPSIRDVCLRYIGKIVYVIGWEKVDFLCSNIYVYPFNVETNTFMPTLEFSQAHRTHLKPKTQFAINDKQAFTSQEDGGIRVWDLELDGRPDTEGCIRVFLWHDKWSFITKFTCFQETSGTDRPHEKKILEGHTNEITELQIFDNFLFSASEGTIKQWDLSTEQCIQTIETGLDKGITHLQVAGQYIFVSTEKRDKVYQWDLFTKNLLFTVDCEYACDTFFPFYNFLFCSHEGEEGAYLIKIYDLSTRKCIKEKVVDYKTCPNEFSENYMQFFDDRLYFIRSFISHDFFPQGQDETQLMTWDFFRDRQGFLPLQ